MDVAVDVATSVPDDATRHRRAGVRGRRGPGPPDFDRATLDASGFGAGVGQTLVLPRVDGPTVIETGLGRRATSTRPPSGTRPPRSRGPPHGMGRWSSTRGDRRLEPAAIGAGRRRGRPAGALPLPRLRDQPAEAHLRRPDARDAEPGTASGRARRRRTRPGHGPGRRNLARDLGNTPATHLTATPLRRGRRGARRRDRAGGRGLRRAAARPRWAAAACSASTPAAPRRPA